MPDKERDEKQDLTGETVHGLKNSWSRFTSWDTLKSDLETEKPKPVAEPKPAVKEPTPDPVEMDAQLVVKMATWLRKKEGLKDKHATYMQKIKNDPSLYEELKNLKRW